MSPEQRWKRTVVALLLSLLLAFSPALAFAAEDSQYEPATLSPAANTITVPATVTSYHPTSLAATVTYDPHFTLGQTARFDYHVSGQESGKKLNYRLYSLSIKEGDYWNSIVDVGRTSFTNYSDASFFEEKFYSAGTYKLAFQAWPYIQNSNGTKKYDAYQTRFEIEFTISEDGSFKTVDSVVQDVSNECLTACAEYANDPYEYDYKKALWLNDWLVKNAQYDYTYEHSHPEGVLLRGEGTCESFHQAYSMLLNKVGVENRRVDSYGDLHVWTGVKMGGEWYNVDTTWNAGAPYASTYPDRNHLYFGVTTDVMKAVHTRWDGTYNAGSNVREPFDAHSYEHNYFIHTGLIYQYMKPYLEPSGTYSAKERFANNESDFTLPLERSSWADNFKNVMYPLVAYQLMQEPWGSVKDLQVSYSLSGLKFHVPLTNITLSGIVDKTYTGSAQTQNLTVTQNGSVLTQGTDYVVQYANNTNTGTATLTVKGLGSHLGSTTATFKINPKAISATTIAALASQNYTGAAFTPKPVVKDGSITLKENTDYTLSYANNTNAGRATVTVNGKGNYTGSKPISFTINAKSIAGGSITTSSPMELNVNGKAMKPTVTVKLGGTTLKEGSQYYLTYNGSKNTPTTAGTYTIKAVGTGNYSGEVTLGTKFVLYKAPTGTVEIASVSNNSFVLDASGSTPKKGANVSIWTDNGGSNQKWNLIVGDDGYYTIRSASNYNYVLDAAKDIPTKGSNVSIWSAKSSNNKNQKWLIVPSGNSYVIKNVANPSVVLDASGATPKKGANVSVWTSNGGKNQLWKIAPVTTPSFDQNRAYVISSRSNSSYVLDASGAVPRRGANVSIWSKNNGNNQKWKLVPAGNGYYYIQSLSNSQFVLDAAGKSPRRGANVSIWTNNYGPNQKWKIDQLADGSYLIRSAANSSYVLDASGATPRRGANVSIWTSNGGNNQKWNITAL